MEHLFCVSRNDYSHLTEEEVGSERFSNLSASERGSQNQSQVSLFLPRHISSIPISATKNINNSTYFSISLSPDAKMHSSNEDKD